MKKLLAIMLALVMVLAMVPALADDQVTQGYCGGDVNAEKFNTITGTTWVYGTKTNFSTDIYKNVSWRLDENGTGTYTLTLSGSGKMADYLAGKVRPWNSYASKITKLIVENGVSSVGSRTCYNFTALTDISLADTVTDIGEFSFSECSALVSVDLSNVTSIRPNALRGDRALSDIQLSHDLKVIDYQAFRDSGADNSSISIPASVTEIGFGAFNGAKFTNVLNLPNVKKVGACAFSNSKFAAVVLTNAELEIVSGKEENAGKEYDDSVFSGNEAVFYTSVSSVMDKLYDNYRGNNIGIIACTNGGAFASEAEFKGFTLAVPQKNGYAFAGWFSNPDLTEKEGLSEENGTYTGTPTTNIHADGRRYYAKWTELPGVTVTFDAQGGTVTPKKMFYENGKVNELPTPTRGGYDFVGWFTAATGGIQVKVDDMLPKDDLTTDGGQEVAPVTAITLYAHWTEQQPSGGGNGGGYYHPTTTPVPVIVIPPKTGDMTVWQSILHFLGIR
ncbi:MAG: leucine-rich repeat protein [Clostridia bacterium]|nr:leucine-rich repeat protein [Clostridia bacterium]